MYQGEIDLTLVDAHLQYLQSGVINTLSFTYQSSTVGTWKIGTLTITSIPPSIWSISSFPAPTASTTGFVGSASVNGISYTGYAGVVSFSVVVESNIQGAFNSATLVIKPSGSGPTSTVAMVAAGSPVLSNGNWYQTYTASIDTGVAGSALASYASCQIGVYATNTSTGVTPTTTAQATFLNRNFAPLANWQVTCSREDITTSGTTIYNYSNTGFSSTWVEGTTTSSVGYTGNGSLYLYDLMGDNIAANSALENIANLQVYANGTLVSGTSWSRIASSGSANPISINLGTSLATNTTYSMYFILTPKATTGAYSTPTQTPAIQVNHLPNTYTCFSGDTYVLTNGGPKHISTLTTGTILLTVSEDNFKAGNHTLLPYIIETVFTHRDGPFQMVNVNGIKTTPDHPWASEGTFLKAEEMSTCVTVAPATSKVTIAPVMRTKEAQEAVVYNLEVAKAATYLVANNIFGPWYLVHNKIHVPVGGQ